MNRLCFVLSLLVLLAACPKRNQTNTPTDSGEANVPDSKDPLWADLEAITKDPNATRENACAALLYLNADRARSLLADCLAPLISDASADVDTRRDAMELLAAANATAGAEILRGVLDDTNPAVRGKAAEVLLRLGDPSGVDVLLSYSSGYNNDRSGAFWLARFIESVPKEKILDAGRDGDKVARRSAAILLGLIGGDAALEVVSMLAIDPDKEARAYAQLAQTNLVDASGLLERLKKDLKARNKLTRFAAVEALGYYGRSLGEVEARALLSSALSDSDPVVQARVVESLILLGGAESGDVLAAKLEGADGVLQGRILRALKELKEPSALEKLLAFARNADINSRGNDLSECLIAYGDPRANEFAQKLLASDLPHIRRAGAQILAALGASSEEVWRPLVTDQDESVRSLALIAAAKGGAKEDTFRDALKDADLSVRAYATVAAMISRSR